MTSTRHIERRLGRRRICEVPYPGRPSHEEAVRSARAWLIRCVARDLAAVQRSRWQVRTGLYAIKGRRTALVWARAVPPRHATPATRPAPLSPSAFAAPRR